MSITEFSDLFHSVSAGASEELTNDMFDRLEEVRQGRSVLRGMAGQFDEFPELPNVWMAAADMPTFLVMSSDGVGEVLRDSDGYSVEGNLGYDLIFGKSLVNTDGEMHARLRALVLPTFRRSRMEEWHRNHIVPTVEHVLAGLRGRRRADLLIDFAFPIPFMVTSQVIGLEDSAQVIVTRAINTILNFTVDVNAAIEASGTLRDAMHELVVARLAEPRDDLVSALLASEIDGQRLEPEQVVDLLRLLAGAAMDTTYRSTGVLLYCLLNHPDQFHAVRDNPALVDSAVDEALRWEAVGPLIPRYARADRRVDGVDIPAGSLVLCCTTMANRDATRWADEPGRFKADRPARTHHTFGGGAHTCLGASLAKQMMTHSLRRLLEAYPHLRFDPDSPAPTMGGLLLRAPTAIPVLLEA